VLTFLHLFFLGILYDPMLACVNVACSFLDSVDTRSLMNISLLRQWISIMTELFKAINRFSSEEIAIIRIKQRKIFGMLRILLPCIARFIRKIRPTAGEQYVDGTVNSFLSFIFFHCNL